MSIWTHVAGVIRFDYLLGLTPIPDCGETCSFEDDTNVWNKCTVPCGSEGSLQVSTWENPCKSSLASLTVSIFGDLRDYDDDQAIIDYFNRITKEPMIRQACFTIGIEGETERTFVFKDKEFKELFKKEANHE
jgi:hypothetical protein